MAEFRIFGSRDEASAALADHDSGILAAAVVQRGNASFIASGGTSPLATFRILRQHKLPWHKITVVPSDERLVPPDHEDCNERMLRRELMRDEAATARLILLAPEGRPDEAWLAKLNSQLGDVGRPLDVVMPGMGADGHTASLFPYAPDIAGALSGDDCCVVLHPAQLPLPRLSLTPVFLLNTREIVLLFFGIQKRAVYDRAMAGDDVRALPVRFVLHQQAAPVTAFWAP